jgi:hypothetical protein
LLVVVNVSEAGLIALQGRRIGAARRNERAANMDAESVAEELEKLRDTWSATTSPETASNQYAELMDRLGIDKELMREAFEIAMARSVQKQLLDLIIGEAWNAKSAPDKLHQLANPVEAHITRRRVALPRRWHGRW